MSSIIFSDYCYNTIIGNYEEVSLKNALLFLASTFAVVSPICLGLTLVGHLIYHSFALKFIACAWFGIFFFLDADSKYYGSKSDIFKINAVSALVASCVSYLFLLCLF